MYVKPRELPRETNALWNFSDVQSPGDYTYLQLEEVVVLGGREGGAKLDRETPLWIRFGECFADYRNRSFYPPLGEQRVFFLARAVRKSAGQVYESECGALSLPADELLKVQGVLRSVGRDHK